MAIQIAIKIAQVRLFNVSKSVVPVGRNWNLPIPHRVHQKMPTTKIPSSALQKNTQHATTLIIGKTKQKLRGMEEEESNMGFNAHSGGFYDESNQAPEDTALEPTLPKKSDKRPALDPFFFRCYVHSQDARKVEKELDSTDNKSKMGIQSQKRQPANQAIKRKPEYQFACYQNQNRMIGGTGANPFAFEGVAFDPVKHCAVCNAEANGRKKPHRRHHKQCPKNRKTKGSKSDNDVKFDEADKKVAANNSKPFNGFNTSSAPPQVREYAQKMLAPLRTDHTNLHDAVRDAMSDPEFVSSATDRKSGAPLPIMAVVRHLVYHKEKKWFQPNTLEFKIPVVRYGQNIDPHYHSVEGQVILNVCWEEQFPGLEIVCPSCSEGKLRRDRTNFSKNKRLFAIFKQGGAPTWAIVMTYKCTHCSLRYDANDGQLLMALPIHVRNAYPVYPKYADNTMSFHLDKPTSQILEGLMLTYGNGDKVSRMIYEGITSQHLEKFTAYLSEWKSLLTMKGNEDAPPLYPDLHGDFITTWPPSGDSLRDLYERAAISRCNQYGVSDKDRCTREIQSVTTTKMFAQDHTMEPIKNYKKSLGAHAVWDSATETGEIATAVCVRNTKTAEFAHAAKALVRRHGFEPVVMYSDTWPNKLKFWKLLFGDDLKGCLGLYHFQQRIIKTISPVQQGPQ